MNQEKNAEMEARIRAFIDNINEKNPDTMCGLIKPAFASCNYEEGSLIMSYPAQSWERNPLGRMQGGIIATLIDFTAGCLSVYESHDMPLTVSLQISYLRPGPLDGQVFVKARNTKAGKHLIHTFVEVWAEAEPDKIIATGNCVYMA